MESEKTGQVDQPTDKTMARRMAQCPVCKAVIDLLAKHPANRRQVRCRHCFVSLWIGESLLGKEITCPQCEQLTRAEASPKNPKARCSACEHQFRVPESVLGKYRPCPACKTQIKVLPTSSKIRMLCQNCQGFLSIPKKLIGGSLRCPGCSDFYRVESYSNELGKECLELKPLVRQTTGSRVEHAKPPSELITDPDPRPLADSVKVYATAVFVASGIVTIIGSLIAYYLFTSQGDSP